MPPRTTILPLLALAVALVPAAARAQQPAVPPPAHRVVAPGAAEVRPRVHEGTDTLQMVMEKDGVEIPVAQLVMETRVDGAAPGGPVIRRVEITVSRMIPSTVDTFALAAATLAPVSQRTYETRTVALDYDSAGVHGSITEGGRTGRVDVRLPVRVWYDNAMDLLLGALPLADGYEASLPTYDDATGTAAWRDLRVVGSEQVAGPSGAVDAWRVETTSRGRTSTYFIDKSTGRMLVWAQKLANGAELRIVR
jgi:hypothetical protein